MGFVASYNETKSTHLLKHLKDYEWDIQDQIMKLLHLQPAMSMIDLLVWYISIVTTVLSTDLLAPILTVHFL